MPEKRNKMTKVNELLQTDEKRKGKEKQHGRKVSFLTILYMKNPQIRPLTETDLSGRYEA